MNFWKDLPKQFTVLAPMEDVTDTVFRQVIMRCGRPDVLFTEFTNCEGMQSVGRSKIIHRLRYDEVEKPIVAQIWGITPEDYFKTAQIISELGFDGVDINMGCPVKKVVKMGACSALIKNPGLAKEIVQATKEGAKNIPVSVKTRIGFNKVQTEDWISFLLSECDLPVLSIHGRTVKEQSNAPCHWDEIAKAVSIRDQVSPETLIVGNGDVHTNSEIYKKVEEYNVDGVMVGRGVFKNPWIFNSNVVDKGQGELRHIDSGEVITVDERVELLKFHLDLWKKTWGESKHYAILKKYYKIYISGFKGSSDIRARLMETKNIEEAESLINNFDSDYFTK